ncbi:hypothetical protein FDK12_07720 [Arthrobacter sp. NamB2]|uniref:hypothetical protein n=1 Tax=Arthrobacter sp. NamB2 TaxID=2576035 RepID=UPI0010C9F7CF|nr:hypothetical protein [Arthrobacter sp. NamB2]TKV28540.1 hypothetical protein FDK12_07720 [Arthrobacter sp. NamB2]
MAAALVALVFGFWRPRSLHWIAVGAVLLFAALNAAAGIYVLSNFNDSRWSPGRDQPLSAPSLSETPLVGEFLVPLDAAMEGVVGGVNDFRSFQQALPIVLEFFAASGWALLVSFPLVILAAGLGFLAAQRRKADFRKFRATVDSLRDELEQIKLQLSSGSTSASAIPLRDGGPETRSQATRG